MRLFNFCKSFLNASECFANVFVACCIAQSDAVGIAEGVAADGCDVGFLKQVEGEVGAVVDGGNRVAAGVVLAEEAAALREEVEGSVGAVHLQPGNTACQFDDEVAAAFKGLAHEFDTLLALQVGCLGCFLAYRRGSAGVLSLQFVASLDDPLWRSHEANAPARHGVSLGNAVDDDGPFAHAGELCDALVLPYINNVFVDLVGEHVEILMPQDDFCECAEFLFGIDAACRVAGRAENAFKNFWLNLSF